MQCPYCSNKINFWVKPSPCPHCKKDIVMKFDYTILLLDGALLGLFYALLVVLLDISGIFKNILLGVVVAFAIFPSIFFKPKDPQAIFSRPRSKTRIWKPVVLGCIALSVMGICWKLFQPATGKTITMVVPENMSEDDVKQLLNDKGVQEFINETAKSNEGPR